MWEREALSGDVPWPGYMLSGQPLEMVSRTDQRRTRLEGRQHGRRPLRGGVVTVTISACRRPPVCRPCALAHACLSRARGLAGGVPTFTPPPPPGRSAPLIRARPGEGSGQRVSRGGWSGARECARAQGGSRMVGRVGRPKRKRARCVSGINDEEQKGWRLLPKGESVSALTAAAETQQRGGDGQLLQGDGRCGARDGHRFRRHGLSRRARSDDPCRRTSAAGYWPWPWPGRARLEPTNLPSGLPSCTTQLTEGCDEMMPAAVGSYRAAGRQALAPGLSRSRRTSIDSDDPRPASPPSPNLVARTWSPSSSKPDLASYPPRWPTKPSSARTPPSSLPARCPSSPASGRRPSPLLLRPPRSLSRPRSSSRLRSKASPDCRTSRTTGLGSSRRWAGCVLARARCSGRWSWRAAIWAGWLPPPRRRAWPATSPDGLTGSPFPFRRHRIPGTSTSPCIPIPSLARARLTRLLPSGSCCARRAPPTRQLRLLHLRGPHQVGRRDARLLRPA